VPGPVWVMNMFCSCFTARPPSADPGLELA
jgi:hypothetical protein